jgi:hypothetical protein
LEVAGEETDMHMSLEVYNAWSIGLQTMIAVAVIATFIVYYGQLKSMQKSAIGQNILALINILQAPYVRDARTIVRAHLKGKPYAEWTKEEKREASAVCSTYDVASILILQQHLVPPEPFVSNWGPSIADCYETCVPLIKEMQGKSGPEYWNDFVLLYGEVMRRSKRP